MGRLDGSRVLYSSASSTGLAMNKSPMAQNRRRKQKEAERGAWGGCDGKVKWWWGWKEEEKGRGRCRWEVVIAFCVVLQWFVLQNHWVPGGEMTRQAQTVHHWHFQTMGGSWNEDDIKYFPLFSQESEQIVATWELILSGYMSTHSQTKAGKMRWSPVQGFMSHTLLS